MIILCALSIHADKVITLNFENNLAFKSAETATWSVFQNLGIFLMFFFIQLKPFKTSYLVPIYIYSIQLYWVFSPEIQFDNYLLQTIAIGSCALFLFIGYMVNNIRILHNKIQEETKLRNQEIKLTIDLLERNILKKA